MQGRPQDSRSLAHPDLTTLGGSMQITSGISGSRLSTTLRYLLGLMLLAAIAIMLIGVALRYLVGPVAQHFNTHIDFFWVEETGELLLGWLTFVGSGIGILERSHFAISLLVEKWSPGAQRLVFHFTMLAAALFGLVLAWQGSRLVILNAPLTTPALEISMGWLYAAVVAGGVLIAVCAVIAMIRPSSVAAVEHVDT
jgi:TRAP-type C4-dicarboxylate transport system permease small subunit